VKLAKDMQRGFGKLLDAQKDVSTSAPLNHQAEMDLKVNQARKYRKEATRRMKWPEAHR
jgi:hypothetical protein